MKVVVEASMVWVVISFDINIMLHVDVEASFKVHEKLFSFSTSPKTSTTTTTKKSFSDFDFGFNLELSIVIMNVKRIKSLGVEKANEEVEKFLHFNSSQPWKFHVVDEIIHRLITLILLLHPLHHSKHVLRVVRFANDKRRDSSPTDTSTCHSFNSHLVM
jgi:hypothetical protein